jgi:glycosyltransferase involved in cell wall biosynthesis
MRICTPHCGIAPESGSGGEVYERELLRDLAGLGVDVHILLARGKPHDTVPGWTVHPVWPPKGLRWPVTPFVFPRAVKRAWDRGGFDLLRAHSVRFIGPAALIARRRYRLPVPIVTHHHHLDPSPLNPYLEKRVLVRSDVVVTDSEFAKRQLADELDIVTDHVRVVYCGVGPKYRPEPKDPSLLRRWRLEGRRVLLSLGPLIERKNPFFLLEAFRDVRAALGESVSLVWVGSGPLKNAVLERARALGIADAVVLTGYVPENEKVATLNLADVFVFPSVLEGFPLAPQEAMSCGKAVVAFRVASLGEMIEDGACGFLTDKNDRVAFADRVVRLLRDPALREKFGHAAAERVDRHFRWDLTVQNVLKIYQETLDEFRRGR